MLLSLCTWGLAKDEGQGRSHILSKTSPGPRIGDKIQQEEGKHMASQLSFLASKSHLLEKLQKSLPKIHLKSQNSTSQKNNISLQSRNNIQASKCYTVITSKNRPSRSKSWGRLQTPAAAALEPWPHCLALEAVGSLKGEPARPRLWCAHLRRSSRREPGRPQTAEAEPGPSL